MLSIITPIPGDAPTSFSLYKHFKGHFAVVIEVAVHTETGDLLVMYQEHGDDKGNTPGRIFARPLEMFNDSHSSGVKRFTFIRQLSAPPEFSQ